MKFVIRYWLKDGAKAITNCDWNYLLVMSNEKLMNSDYLIGFWVNEASVQAIKQSLQITSILHKLTYNYFQCDFLVPIRNY
jgi:hypothetical protein